MKDGKRRNSEHDKTQPKKRAHVVAVEDVRDKYGSVIALRVVLYRRRKRDGKVLWESRKSHVFDALFGRRSAGERADELARQWAERHDADVVRIS